MPEYDFEIDRIVEDVKKNNARLVGLQFPEGLKKNAVWIAREIEEKTAAATIIFIDPTYGACDTKDQDAQVLGVDLIVHFGHTSKLPNWKQNSTA